MSQTRYCSTCGALLSEGAAICGECGARYLASPYERRATDMPGAWSQAPAPRSRDLGHASGDSPQDDGIELISRESLIPAKPGETSLRSPEQYDQMMVTQPPMNQTGPGPAPGMPDGPGSAAPASGAPSAGAPMAYPLDGCAPASPLKRLLAALADSVIAVLVLAPLMVGGILAAVADEPGLLPLILIGVGAALPAAYALLMIWLVGAKGFSLGKLIFGLRVTREGVGGSLGFVRALGRAVLYGLVPPIMALSIFIDPERHLRGFHDRIIDSVVTDIKQGRNPMRPRPDDFERESAEHYLGAPSVAVSTHQNLLSEPGAVWKDESGRAPAQPSAAGSGAWGGHPQMAPSPYAPPVSGTSAPEAPLRSGGWDAADPAPEPPTAWGGEGAWEPPPVEPLPPSQSWDLPAAPSQGWGQSSAPQQWDQPAAPAQGWAPPEPPLGQAPHQAQSPAAHEPAGAPSELTGDAWNSEVDEQTRLSVPDEPLGDLEQTRITPARIPAVKKLRLITDDGAERIVENAVVIGRNPSAPGEEVLFVMKDDTRSVSKAHLLVDGKGDDITVTDLGSTNGSTILREDGSRENLVPNSPTVLPTGAQLTLGDRTLSVERAQ
ncbi:MAG: FHA domain-containing protein [Actinomycetales bacterium]|nr:FHA domain-containing protein [Actinomycetales bacterium]